MKLRALDRRWKAAVLEIGNKEILFSYADPVVLYDKDQGEVFKVSGVLSPTTEKTIDGYLEGITLRAEQAGEPDPCAEGVTIVDQWEIEGAVK